MNFSKNKTSDVYVIDSQNNKTNLELSEVETLWFKIKETWGSKKEYGFRSIVLYDSEDKQIDNEEYSFLFTNKTTKWFENPEERIK